MVTRALAVVVAGILLLSGCSLYAPLPEPLSAEEVSELLREERANYWQAISGGSPYPEVEIVAVLPLEDVWPHVVECVDQMELEGIVASGQNIQLGPGGDQSELERAMFACNEAYPPVTDDPAVFGYYSREELEYLWSYYSSYLVPCLRMHGYALEDVPARDGFIVGPYMNWNPYAVMRPSTGRDFSWKQVDADCAPPPIGQAWRPSS